MNYDEAHSRKGDRGVLMPTRNALGQLHRIAFSTAAKR